MLPPHRGMINTRPMAEPVSSGQAAPLGAFPLELLIHNGFRLKTIGFFLESHLYPGKGAMIHATGSVFHGFKFEIHRWYNLADTSKEPIEKRWLGRWSEATSMKDS